MTDDDEDWDRWMALTPAQQDAEMAVEMRRYNRMIDRMTLAEHARYLRGSVLQNCLTSRRTIAKLDLPVFREMLRRSQRQLLKVREYRQTGIYPGEGS